MSELIDFWNRRRAAFGIGHIQQRGPVLVALFAFFPMIALPLYLQSAQGKISCPHYAWQTRLGLATVYLLFPALFEETLWRVGCIPYRCIGNWSKETLMIVGASAGAAALAHLLVGILIPVTREVFCDPWFLTIVLWLGLVSGALYIESGSVWPSVFLHWSTVVCWKFFLGGPRLFL